MTNQFQNPNVKFHYANNDKYLNPNDKSISKPKCLMNKSKCQIKGNLSLVIDSSFVICH
jgi:hypothetical protein